MTFGSGLLTVENAQTIAYSGGYSSYSWTIPSSTTSSSSVVSPGYNPSNYAKSMFTVYNTSATTSYYEANIVQATGTSSSTPENIIANNVMSVPLMTLSCAVDSSNNLLYYEAVGDLTLNAPTNPSSSIYNIFLNLVLYNSVSGLNTNSSLPWLNGYTYGSTTSTDIKAQAPICDVILKLSSTGSETTTAVFSLNSTEVTVANSTGPITSSNSATQGATTFILNFPLSSIFPQISVPGIVYRVKAEIIGYI